VKEKVENRNRKVLSVMLRDNITWRTNY